MCRRLYQSAEDDESDRMIVMSLFAAAPLLRCEVDLDLKTSGATSIALEIYPRRIS